MDSISKSGANPYEIKAPPLFSPRSQNPKSDRSIKPYDIHELKILTTRIQQESKLLKANLSRLNDKIVAKTNSIKRSVNNASNFSNVNEKQTKINQLSASIGKAKDTLEALDLEIQKATNDDKTSAVFEIQEELKIAYCEYLRQLDEIQQKMAETQSSEHKLEIASQKASPQYLQHLKSALETIRSNEIAVENKIEAYQNKLEKLKVESQISERQDSKISLEYAMKDIAYTKERRLTKKFQIQETIVEKKSTHEQNIKELRDIIMNMRQTISNHLQVVANE